MLVGNAQHMLARLLCGFGPQHGKAIFGQRGFCLFQQIRQAAQGAPLGLGGLLAHGLAVFMAGAVHGADAALVGGARAFAYRQRNLFALDGNIRKRHEVVGFNLHHDLPVAGLRPELRQCGAPACQIQRARGRRSSASGSLHRRSQSPRQRWPLCCGFWCPASRC